MTFGMTTLKRSRTKLVASNISKAAMTIKMAVPLECQKSLLARRARRAKRLRRDFGRRREVETRVTVAAVVLIGCNLQPAARQQPFDS